MVSKGSVCLEGGSLTGATGDDREFRVSVIPHTREITALSEKKPGDVFNIETDMIGKYIEKLTGAYLKEDKPSSGSGITMDFLRENGF